MINIAEAQSLILQQTSIIETEEVPLLQALGRIIISDIHSPWDLPSADNSAMDGYAFSHESLHGNYLKVTDFLPAGMERIVPVVPGEAVKIMTGAHVPPGCDTVVPIEDVEEVKDGIRLKGEVRPGLHIRKKGENTSKGDLVIASGTILGPQEIGMLVTMGRLHLPVYRIPSVAVIATGDELVEAGATPVATAKINSNSYSIAAQIIEAGARPVMLGIAKDNRESTREKIFDGLNADVVIISGGVSAGDRDYVKEVIQELGGEILFWKVNMKPGKPFAFAILNGKMIFALPGNPVSTMIAFELFVRPALLKMMSHVRIFRPVVKATITDHVRNKGDRPHLVFSKVTLNDGMYVVETTGDQNSSNLGIMLQANGIIEVAPGETINPGTEINVNLLNREFEMRPV
ncbi:MAG: molybdopterin molybdotransferase MoeA [Desulfuromonadaceae bacterium]|nr:molybdopterin molybdotransferase MoeA [Desulfuromonadaceae bacterium]